MAVDSLRARTSVPQHGLEHDWRLRAMDRLATLRLSRATIVVLLLALAGISLVLRMRQLDFHFWVDEGISVGIASHPLNELTHLLREDGSPPLYYLLLHVWMQAFGRGEVATHVLSLLFALISIPVAYWAGTSLFGRRTGAYCAVLTAGLPFLSGYAQETRMYSLIVLLSLLLAAAFLHAFVFRRRRYLPLFVLSLTALLYTHNWALFLGLMTFVAFLVCVRLEAHAERRGLWIDGALAFGAVALLYLPWLPTLLYQAQHTGAPWALPPILWSFTQGAYYIVGGRGAAVAILFGAGAGFLALRATGFRERGTRPAIILLTVLGVGTVVLAWLYAKTTPAWAFRYLAVVIGPLLLLVGLGLSRGAKLGLVAIVLLSTFWVLDPGAPLRSAKSNVAADAAKVKAYVGPTSLVLSTQPEQVPTLAYYLPRVRHFATPLGRVPDPRVMDWRNGLERFNSTSVKRRLVPLLATLKRGERVALAVPVHLTTAPRWMELIRSSTYNWARYLEHDRALTLLKATSPYLYSTSLPVRIYLYAVTGSTGTRT